MIMNQIQSPVWNPLNVPAPTPDAPGANSTKGGILDQVMQMFGQGGNGGGGAAKAAAPGVGGIGAAGQAAAGTGGLAGAGGAAGGMSFAQLLPLLMGL